MYQEQEVEQTRANPVCESERDEAKQGSDWLDATRTHHADNHQRDATGDGGEEVLAHARLEVGVGKPERAEVGQEVDPRPEEEADGDGDVE